MKQVINQLKARKRTGKSTVGAPYIARLAMSSGATYTAMLDMLIKEHVIKRDPNNSASFQIIIK